VAQWASAAFPIVLIDEAQDLSPGRLAIVRALAKRSEVFVAGDEFQCLQEKLRPNPFQQWASTLGTRTLTTVRRTNEAELLSAAAALRAGGAPMSGKRFKIHDTHNAALAGAYLVNALARQSTGTVAVITAAMDDFATDAVEWARRNKSSTGLGPVSITWETGDNEESAELITALSLGDDPLPVNAAISAIERLPSKAVAAYVGNWAERQRNALGRSTLSHAEIEEAVLRGVTNRKRFSRQNSERLIAMTVYAAKNREFDGVIVLWPGRVGGSADQKRRLLYNAITRARRWAIVLVQSKKLRAAPPFI
jgi:superfamily I DNA/RNA helicase